MPRAASSEVAAAVADAHRREWAFVLAATVRVAGGIDAAEEAVQDAYASALATWGERGIPAKPGAWLTVAARHRALDMHRRAAMEQRALPKLASGDEYLPEDPGLDDDEIADDRLRLIFTCCHPALALEAQVALTLRLLCGLSTGEVARAFLVPEATMAARITRAKKKIAAARIPYRVPAPDQLAERVAAVLEVVHLIFTTGHTAPTGPHLLRPDLLDRAVDLGRMLHLLMPTNAEITALLALMLLIDARSVTRTAYDGRMLLLAEQDRTRWDAGLIREGVALLTEALRRHPPTRYSLQAAIAAVHAESPTWADTDWPAIVTLYDLLLRRWPSPVVQLNRAAAIGWRDGPRAGLDALTPLMNDPALATYPYLSATRADFLRRLHRRAEAAEAY